MIAYSVLVPDCDTVDYFIGIDSYTNGQIQAKYLVKKLGLKDTKQSFNLKSSTSPATAAPCTPSWGPWTC